MTGFEALATATFTRAGVAVNPEDLSLVRLVYEGVFPLLAALDGVDTARFPFEPVDPSRAPGPS
jgi:hypothetical protein